MVLYVTGSGKRDIFAHIFKIELLALSYIMHHSFRCQSNVLRSYGRERSLVFVYSKKQRFEKTLIEVLLPVERRFSVILKTYSGYAI